MARRGKPMSARGKAAPAPGDDIPAGKPSGAVSRRAWLGRVGAVGLLGWSTGCAGRYGQGRGGTVPVRFEFERPQMGVPFRVVVHAGTRAEAEVAVGAAFARVEALNRILSDYDPDSEVSRLCAEAVVGRGVEVSPDLWRMLVRGQGLAEATDGAFDVTVGPLVNLWRRARRRVELPPEHLVAEARARSGWRHLRLEMSARTVAFGVPGMRLDFGGIAKGYAADEALRVLREHGLARALVAAAGDVVVGAPPPGESGWRVEIAGAEAPGVTPSGVASLRNAAVSTSGDVFQRLEIGGRRYSHILDPRTGIGLTDQSLVTVIAHDGTTSDSVSTAVSVLGPERGVGWVEGMSGVAARVIRSGPGGMEVRESRRWRRWVSASRSGSENVS